MTDRLVNVAASLIVIGGVIAGASAQSVSSTPARDSASLPRVRTAMIRGRVTTADSDAPLRRSDVRLTSLSAAGAIEVPVVATDEQGYYEFKALAGGRYTLAASKSGYLTMAFGQRRPRESARPVEIADGQTLDHVDIPLPKGATIVARITDLAGEPMSDIDVQVLEYRFVGPELQSRFPIGERRLVSIGQSFGPGAGTNDLGVQRLYGLAPGEYYVAVRGLTLGPADKQRTYAPTFYPGTASLVEAQRVSVAVGQEVSVSFPLVAQRAFRISGVVRGSSGAVFSRAPIVTLFDASPTSAGSARAVTAQPDGSFAFANVFPGDYTIHVTENVVDRSMPPEFVKMPVTVLDRDLENVRVATNPGATVHGRLVFDTGATPTGMRPGSVQFTVGYPAGSCVAGRTTWNPDWTFESRGVNCSAGQLALNSATAPGWFLKAFLLDGRDVSDMPVEFAYGRDIKDLQVVLTQKRTEVSGRAVSGQGSAVSDYVALLFPEDRALWTGASRFIAASRPNQVGQFQIVGLPPGKYLAAAIDYLASGEERNPELLGRLADRAIAFTLGEGEAKALRLTLVTY